MRLPRLIHSALRLSNFEKEHFQEARSAVDAYSVYARCDRLFWGHDDLCDAIAAADQFRNETAGNR